MVTMTGVNPPKRSKLGKRFHCKHIKVKNKTGDSDAIVAMTGVKPQNVRKRFHCS